MLSFKLLPHTADLIIQLEATSLEELFKAAVFGLVSVLKPEDLVINKKDFEHQKEIESNSINLLLVDFLSDILTLIHIRKGLVSDIEILSSTESYINYKAYFQKVDNFERDVKAISYHNVKITLNDRNLYEAEIIIDI
jgi:SHS2 domain-containing protein